MQVLRQVPVLSNYISFVTKYTLNRLLFLMPFKACFTNFVFLMNWFKMFLQRASIQALGITQSWSIWDNLPNWIMMEADRSNSTLKVWSCCSDFLVKFTFHSLLFCFFCFANWVLRQTEMRQLISAVTLLFYSVNLSRVVAQLSVVICSTFRNWL